MFDSWNEALGCTDYNANNVNSLQCTVAEQIKKKSCVRETKNLSSDAYSRTDTIWRAWWKSLGVGGGLGGWGGGDTSPFLGLHVRADSVHSKIWSGVGEGGGVRLIWNTSPFLGLHARADLVHRPRSMLKNYMKRGQTYTWTLQLYERIGLRADSLKTPKITIFTENTILGGFLYFFSNCTLQRVEVFLVVISGSWRCIWAIKQSPMTIFICWVMVGFLDFQTPCSRGQMS